MANGETQYCTVSKNIKAAFRSVDVDNTGYIHRDRLKKVFKHLCSWTEFELNLLFNGFDRQGDGYLAYEEFVDWVMGAFKQAKIADTVATVSDPSEVPRMLVGTFNMLGDSFNPFEFLPLDDNEFMNEYGKLRDRASGPKAIKWADLEPYAAVLSKKHEALAAQLDKLKTHCSSSSDASLWSYFNEEVLDKDNKYMAPRINLITFAMKPVDEEDLSKPPIWKLNQYNKQEVTAVEGIPWFSALLECIYTVEEGKTKPPYLRDPNLLLWDLSCNVIAVLEQEAYIKICSTSYLHPDNYESIGLEFLKKVADSKLRGTKNGEELPVILGFQEWPSEGTTKATVMTDLFTRKGFKILLGPTGTALGYQGDLGCPMVLTEVSKDRGAVKDESLPSLGDDLKRVDTKQAMQKTIEAAQKNGVELDKKTIEGLVNTTALKSFGVLFCGTIFMVIHAKEPKTEEVGKLLATYCQNVIEDCRRLLRASCVDDESTAALSRSWVIVADTNIAKPSIAKSFEESADAQVVPESLPTTSKHRSILHGQCYDLKKCNKTVTAPKDHIVAPFGSLQGVEIQPDITKGITLPSPHWGSDHALLTVVYNVPDPQTQPTVNGN